jgi:chorismate mutase
MNRLKNLAVDTLFGDDLKVLQVFRDKIDGVDQSLIQLFDQRAALVFKVGEWKKENACEVHDPKREQQIFEKICRTHRSHLRDSEV